MKNIVSVCLIQLVLTVSIHAQTIKGIVKEKGMPVSGATISLHRSADSAFIKINVSAADGSFSFLSVDPGLYFVQTSFVGFEPLTSETVKIGKGEVMLTDLELFRTSANMQDVVITAKKRLIDVKADKVVMNVEGTIQALGNTALDLLRKAPLVTMDKDNSVQLNGNSGVAVYIDGKRSPLSGRELSSYLQSLQSSQIEAIELITQPSAKYEATGSGGIINIKLKKNRSLGTNASVNTGMAIARYAKYTGGLAIAHRNNKLNLFGSYQYSNSANYAKLGTDRLLLDTLFHQRGGTVIKENSLNIKTGFDYQLNKKSSIGLVATGNLAAYNLNSGNLTHIVYQPSQSVNRLLKSGSNGKLNRNDFGLNLSYALDNGNGNSLLVNADHNTFRINDDVFQPNYYVGSGGEDTLSRSIYNMASSTDIEIASINADYERNFMKGKLGFGGKFANIVSDNNLQLQLAGNQNNVDNTHSHFLYKEKIAAVYINFNRKYKFFSLQTGLRIENTNTEGISLADDKTPGNYGAPHSTYAMSYTSFFPSTAIRFSKNPEHSFSLLAGRRIDRPNYQNLNPFAIGVDEYMSQRGNPSLRPQYATNFSLVHSYKNKLNSSFNFTSISDRIISIIDSTERSKALITKVNIASEKIYSLNLAYPFTYKAYSLSANMAASYKQLNAQLGAGRIINLRALSVNLNVQNTITFGKSWAADLSGFFRSPFIDGSNLKSQTMWSVDAGIQKKLFNGRGIFKLSVTDLFNSFEVKSSSYFAGQEIMFNKKTESRQGKLSFIYNLGKGSIKNIRPKGTPTEETKRVQ